MTEQKYFNRVAEARELLLSNDDSSLDEVYRLFLEYCSSTGVLPGTQTALWRDAMEGYMRTQRAADRGEAK